MIIIVHVCHDSVLTSLEVPAFHDSIFRITGNIWLNLNITYNVNSYIQSISTIFFLKMEAAQRAQIQI